MGSLAERACQYLQRRCLGDTGILTIVQPAGSYSNAIERPPCSKCGTQMLLAGIVPDRPDHDRRTFECAKCQNSESFVVKYK